MSAIDRRLARTVLADVLESEGVMGSLEDLTDVSYGDTIAAAVDRLMVAAAQVDRKRTRDLGEVVVITYRIPPDPTEDEEGS